MIVIVKIASFKKIIGKIGWACKIPANMKKLKILNILFKFKYFLEQRMK